MLNRITEPRKAITQMLSGGTGVQECDATKV